MDDVETAVGERFEVGIEAVPTSGFTWTVAELDGERLRLLGNEVDVTSERIGGSAVQRFRFEALAEGEAELRFELRRPWESKPPVEERIYRVVVRA